MALTDLVRPRINELGKIKIGGLGEARKSRSGGTYRMPDKYDHFVVTTLQRNPAGDLMVDTALMNSLKEYADSDGKLRQLPVYVLSNEPEDIMQSAFVWYEGKRVAARSDGVTLTIFYDAKKGEWLDKPRETEWDPTWRDLKDSKGNRRFKLHTTFNVVIAASEARYGGFYKLRTTSQISADQLYGSLIHLRELTGGILRGLPLRLVVRPMQVSPNGTTTTVYVVHLEIRGPDLMSIQQLALDRAKFEVANRRQLETARLEYRKLLALPGYGENPAEQAGAAEEFHAPDDGERVAEPDAPAQPDPLAAELGIGPAPGDAAEAPEPAAEEPPPEESDEPTADIGDWSDDDAEARAKEQQEKLAATR